MPPRSLTGRSERAQRSQYPVIVDGVVRDEEIDSWERAAAAMAVPHDPEHDIPAQDRNFNQHQEFPFQVAHDLGRYPLLLHVPYFGLYRRQVSKQADLVLALHWRGDEFDLDQKARAFAYYEGLTVRDSSLSACTQAIVAAEVGQLDLASDYLAEAALMDLHDLEHNTRDGLHIASLAGSWLALVAGFGGMRDHQGQLSFRPSLPTQLTRLAFAVGWHETCVHVEITTEQVTYRMTGDANAELSLQHYGERFTVGLDAPVTLPTKRTEPLTPRPRQPVGREPRRATPPPA